MNYELSFQGGENLIMKLLSKLYPKEKDFYRMLYEQSSKALEGIKQLGKYMETGLEEDGKKIIVFEREADELRRILIEELNKTFITPFEREDIYAEKTCSQWNETLRSASSRSHAGSVDQLG